ncbi:MAG: HD domain-containing protein [Bacteroidetes bacterium]|nr:MAG: HD domain-containing protein [Bacteroidota bacterium]
MIKIQDVLRAGHIKRWQIVNTTRQQTLAEHLFNVAMIGKTICERCDLEDIKEIVMEWALIHDLPEVVCGDMPTPTKKRILDAGFDMEYIYDKIDPMYREVKLEAYAQIMPNYIVKAADLIESIHFISDHGIGRHARMVCARLIRKFDDHIGSNLYDYRREIRRIYDDVINGDFYE